MRESGSSRRPARSAPDKSERKAAAAVLRSWWNEAVAVMLFALAAYLLLSLVIVLGHRNGYWILAEGATPVGPLGHVSATLLTGLLGYAGFIPVFWLIGLALRFWRNDSQPISFNLRTVLFLPLGLVISLVCLAAIFSAVFSAAAGGSVGRSIAVPLQQVVGIYGGILALLAVLLTSVALSARVTLGAVLKESLIVIVQAVWFCCLSLPLMLWRTASLLLSAAWRSVKWFAHQVGAYLYSVPKKPQGWDAQPSRRRTAREEGRSEKPREIAPLPEPANPTHDDIASDDEPVKVVVRRPDREQRLNEAALKKARAKLNKGKSGEDEARAYVAPEVSLLTRGEPSEASEADESLHEKSKMIESKLRDFGIMGKVTQIHPGPVITLFEFEPAPGIKVGKIAALADDLAMSLRASSIRIIAPIPRRGTVGIEIPNKSRDIVRLRDVLENEEFFSSPSILNVPIGKDTYGEPVFMDIASMPHLLMAGATGTGKSVSINAILVSLLCRATPDELGLILIDPKILELSVYESIPHLRVPVVTAPRQARAVLEWATREMDRRYRLIQRFRVRNIDSYNRIARGEEEPEEAVEKLAEQVVVERTAEGSEKGAAAEGDLEPAPEPVAVEEIKPLPKIVIVIDELADLMLTVGRDIEELITRLAQKARAAGIHLILATQRPSVDVITGLIKANIPARISFRVASRIDSRTILDSMGAEKLLGRGDMLMMLPGAEALRRAHGAYVSDNEVKRVVEAARAQGEPRYDEQIIAMCERAMEEERAEREGGALGTDEQHDEMYDKCVALVLERGQASTSMLQRAFRLGYNRAARIIDMMEKEGIVGPMDGAKPREVLLQHLRADEGL